MPRPRVRRALRHAFTILSALSLLLCVAACVLWVRSYSNSLHVGWPTRSGAMLGSREIAVSDGLFRFYSEMQFPIEDFRYQRPPAHSHVNVAPRTPPADLHLDPGSAIHSSPAIPANVGFLWLGAGYRSGAIWGMRFRSYFAPAWLIVGATALLPSLWFWRNVVAAGLQARRRMARGLCPSCGYDLRGSRERCPECGTVVAKPA